MNVARRERPKKMGGASLPADPAEGERGAKNLGGEDAGHTGEKSEDERGGTLEEDGVGRAEREHERVRRDVRRRRPRPQRAPRLPERRHCGLPVPPVPPPSSHSQRGHSERRGPASPTPPPRHRWNGSCFGSAAPRRTRRKRDGVRQSGSRNRGRGD